MYRTFLLLALAAILSGCLAQPLPSTRNGAAVTVTPAPSTNPTISQPIEVPVTQIPLKGPVSKKKAEVSSMAWYGDDLILVPQFPTRMTGEAGGAVYALPKADILAFLDGQIAGPLTPEPVRVTGDPGEQIEGFEGFEAIAFHGNTAYLTIEASPNGVMKSYLLRGVMAPDRSELRLETSKIAEVPLDVQISNFSNEAIVIDGERVILFYEANGATAYPESRAQVYTLNLEPAGTLDLPALEYRLTDATPVDAQGRFWVSNYFFFGDLKILPKRDPLAEQYGEGPDHAASSTVERLVELQLPSSGADAITFAGTPPIQLQLAGDETARNWEGIVRLEGRGFLLITDQHPETILGFVKLK